MLCAINKDKMMIQRLWFVTSVISMLRITSVLTSRKSHQKNGTAPIVKQNVKDNCKGQSRKEKRSNITNF